MIQNFDHAFFFVQVKKNNTHREIYEKGFNKKKTTNNSKRPRTAYIISFFSLRKAQVRKIKALTVYSFKADDDHSLSSFLFSFPSYRSFDDFFKLQRPILKKRI